MEANMANVNHSALTDPYLHEPKGAAAATSGQVYVADGAASGAWASLDAATTYIISGVIDDISTAATVYIPTPEAGTVKQVTTVLSGAIATADVTVLVKDAAAATMGTITVAFTGSAAADIDSTTPSTNNTFTANSFVTIATDGASTNVVKLYFSLLVERS
jgi:hypothetical protein